MAVRRAAAAAARRCLLGSAADADTGNLAAAGRGLPFRGPAALAAGARGCSGAVPQGAPPRAGLARPERAAGGGTPRRAREEQRPPPEKGGADGAARKEEAAAAEARGHRRRAKQEDQEEILPPGTRYQGRRYGVQFFVGDLVEVVREGRLARARLARSPTDERPMDGSFVVKWDDNGREWKCSYKDLRKPRNPDVPLPDWIEDWWPDEPPPTLAEEYEKEWTWVSDLRPGGRGGGMIPEPPEDHPYAQNKDDPYRPTEEFFKRLKEDWKDG